MLLCSHEDNYLELSQVYEHIFRLASTAAKLMRNKGEAADSCVPCESRVMAHLNFLWIPQER